MASEGRSHCEMAHEIYAVIEATDKVPPLADAGALYRYSARSGLWVRHELDALARFVGNAINERNCKRVSDYRGIASLVYSNAREGIAGDGSPFDVAPPGIAANGMFFRMNGKGVETAKLGPNHLARFAVPEAPDAKHPRPLFTSLIEASFPASDPDHEEQRVLLQQHFGACVVGAAARMQKAMLWRGVERSGKSTLQEILRSMFMPENVAAVPPHLWFHEYHVAALANMIVNTVGEVDDKRPLTVAFKNVIGRDLLHGRHVTHRPFSFRNEAAHVFNSNGFPPTEDQSNAFWDRWSVLEFRHTRPPEKRDDRLAEKVIEAELPAVLAWALEGARLLAQHGGRFLETNAHRTMMDKWRGRTDSVRSWLLDPEAVELYRDSPELVPDEGYWMRSQTELHRHYCRWCQLARRHALGLHTFGDALRNAFAWAGLKEDTGTHKLFGVHPLELPQ